MADMTSSFVEDWYRCRFAAVRRQNLCQLFLSNLYVEIIAKLLPIPYKHLEHSPCRPYWREILPATELPWRRRPPNERPIEVEILETLRAQRLHPKWSSFSKLQLYSHLWAWRNPH